MSDAQRFYDTMYGSAGADAQAKVRLETYGEDIGQAGWLLADEAREFASWLGPERGHILDVGCGSGGISALLSREIGSAVIGVDVNETAIETARDRSAERCEFQVADASARWRSRMRRSMRCSVTRRSTILPTAPLSFAIGPGSSSPAASSSIPTRSSYWVPHE